MKPRRTFGQSATEMALVMPVILLFAIGIVELGRIVFIFSALNNASREAARFGASVGQTAADTPTYLDCAAIRQRARETAFLAGLEDSDIVIAYDTPNGGGTMSTYGPCGAPDLDAEDVLHGDRVVITITASIEPILAGFLPLPTFSPTFVSARTILKDITIGPVECSDGLDNDGDGLTDFPNDTGCTGPDDTTEAFCYSLSVAGAPPEGGNLSIVPGPNCANRYIEQTFVTLQAFPAPQYVFNYWSGDAAGVDPVTSVTMDADKDVVANFRRLKADLAVTKTDSPDPVLSNEALTYNIVVTNLGGDTANGVVITDTLPAGVALQSVSITGGACPVQNNAMVRCQVANLPATGQVNLDIVVTAPTVSFGSTTITNTVTVGGQELDPDLSNNTAVAVTTVGPRAELTLVDKVDSADPVPAKTNFDYTITVFNAGPSAATGVTITDPLPPGMTFVSSADSCNNVVDPDIVVCTIGGAISAGGTVSVTFTVNAPSSGGLVTNTAWVSGNEAENDATDNQASEQTQVLSHANLSLTKTAPASAPRDVAFNYTLTVNNSGPSSALNVTLEDTLPAGVLYNSYSGAGAICSVSGNVVSCDLDVIASGASRVVTLNVTPTTTGNLVNTATVSSATNDPSPSNNSDSAATTVTASVALGVTKTANAATVDLGEVFTYTINANNLGPSNATNVQIVDNLPAQVTFGSVTVGSGWTCGQLSGTVTCQPSGGIFVAGTSATIRIRVTAAAVGTAANTATLNATEGTASSTVNTTIEPSLDLAISLAGPISGTVDVPFNYTLTATRTGPSPATGVRVVLALDDNLSFWAVAPPPSGWSCGYDDDTHRVICDQTSVWTTSSPGSAEFTVSAIPQFSGTMTSAADITANESLYDTNPQNDTDIHQLAVP